MSEIKEPIPEESLAPGEQPLAPIEQPLAAVEHPLAPAAETSPQGKLALLKEALRGSSLDYTQGPVGHALLMLAIPMVLETALESVFALTNIFWVSRLGAGAITSVGLTESIVTLVYTIAIGLSIHRWHSRPMARPTYVNVDRYYSRVLERSGFRRYGRDGGP